MIHTMKAKGLCQQCGITLEVGETHFRWETRKQVVHICSDCVVSEVTIYTKKYGSKEV